MKHNVLRHNFVQSNNVLFMAELISRKEINPPHGYDGTDESLMIIITQQILTGLETGRGKTAAFPTDQKPKCLSAESDDSTATI